MLKFKKTEIEDIEIFKKYIQNQINKLNYIKNNLTNKYFIKKIKLEKEIRFLKRI